MAVAENMQVVNPVPTHLVVDGTATLLIRPAVYLTKEDTTVEFVGMGLPKEVSIADFMEQFGGGGSSDPIAIADVTGLTDALAGKAASVHNQGANTISVNAVATLTGSTAQLALEALAARIAVLEAA